MKVAIFQASGQLRCRCSICPLRKPLSYQRLLAASPLRACSDIAFPAPNKGRNPLFDRPTTIGTSSGGQRQDRGRRRPRRQGSWRPDRHQAHLDHRRDEALLPRLRHERDRVARAARRARRPEARAPAHPVRHARAGPRPQQEIRQERPRGRRGDGQVPPARQPADLRRAGAHGAGLLHARHAGRRPGQLRLDRRRSAGGRPLHRMPAHQDRRHHARRSRQGHRRVPRELRRHAEGAVRPPVQVPQPAGQRLGRHRRRHGHQHPARTTWAR